MIIFFGAIKDSNEIGLTDTFVCVKIMMPLLNGFVGFA
jgi:hypothetical protein